MPDFIFANNVLTTLAGAFSSSAASFTLASAAHLPTSIPVGKYLVITLNDAATRGNYEVIYVGTISGATCSNLLRAQEGTAALSWLIGDYAYSAPTAGQQESFGQLGGINTWTGQNNFEDPVGVGAATATGEAVTLGQVESTTSPLQLATLPATLPQQAMAFSQAWSFNGVTLITGNTTLTEGAFGTICQPPNGSSGGWTIAMPTSGDVGQVLAVFNSSSGNFTLTAGNLNTSYGTGVTSIVLPPNSTAILEFDGVSYNGIGGSASFGGAVRPQAAAGVGAWGGIFSGGNYLYLPPGGTWAYFAANDGVGYTGIAAGGANITGTVTLINAFGFCWRIA